jgi:hypothetical protein
LARDKASNGNRTDWRWGLSGRVDALLADSVLLTLPVDCSAS